MTLDEVLLLRHDSKSTTGKRKTEDGSVSKFNTFMLQMITSRMWKDNS